MNIVAKNSKQSKARGQKADPDTRPVTLARYELERLDGLLVRAQDLVMRAPPGFNGGIPTLYGPCGNAAAVSAHSDIRQVRDALAELLRGAS